MGQSMKRQTINSRRRTVRRVLKILSGMQFTNKESDQLIASACECSPHTVIRWRYKQSIPTGDRYRLLSEYLNELEAEGSTRETVKKDFFLTETGTATDEIESKSATEFVHSIPVTMDYESAISMCRELIRVASRDTLTALMMLVAHRLSER